MLPAVLALQMGKTPAEQAAVEVALQLLAHESRQRRAALAERS